MKQSTLIISFLVLFLLSKKTGAVNGIGAISKTKFLQPYDDNGKTTFRNANKKPGVYLIKENGEIVYVGYSGKNIYRTMYRHFQKWDHPYQEVITYNHSGVNKYTVRVIFTTPQQAERLEAYLINKYKPRDNSNKLAKYEGTDTGKKEFQKYQQAEVVEEMPF